MNRDIKIAIHRRKGSFSDRWTEYCKEHGIHYRDVCAFDPDIMDQIRDCDGFMWHWAHYPHEQRLAALPILRVIEEHLRIPVFPDMATCWHYDDKVAQSYLLEALGIPHPKTWGFWRKADALEWCETAEFPVVAKLSGGAGSTNVRLIRGLPEAKNYVERCFSGSGIVSWPPLPAQWPRRPLSWAKRLLQRALQAGPYVGGLRFPAMPDPTFWMPQKNYALFQEFLPGNEYDTRVTVIGDRAFAFRRFNRPDDFRASGSGKIDHAPGPIDLRCVSAAFAAAKILKSQSMAFDFLFRGEKKEPVVGEISYGYADWAVEQCPGHWDAEMNWHAGHLWPEAAHMEDFVRRIQDKHGS